MSSGISRANLFGKLNSIGYKALEGATVFCKLRGNPYVELVHWLHQIMQTQDSDLHRIIKASGIDPRRLELEVTEDVLIKDGEERPILIEIVMNNSSGIYQVDGLLKAKLRGSGLEPYVEVLAHIDTEAEKRLVPLYELEL